MVHIPLEIWLLIASFVPEEEFGNLLGLNVFFYNFILDSRYRDIRVDFIGDYMLKKLARLKDPAIARRVGKLHLNLQFDTTLRKKRNIWLMGRDHLGGLEKFRYNSEFTLEERRARRMYHVPIDKIVRALIAAFKRMSNISELTIDWWQDSAARYLEPCLPAIWKSFGHNLRSLTLGGRLSSVKMLVESLSLTTPAATTTTAPMAPVLLSALEALSFDFAHDPSLSEAGEELTQDFFITTTIGPLITTLSPHLRSLSVSSWSHHLSLAPLFTYLAGGLPPIPHLYHLTIRAPFHKAFPDDHSARALTHFLRAQSTTIRSVDLAFFPAYPPAHDDVRLASWLTEISTDDDAATSSILAHLDTLHIYPTTMHPAGITALQSLVRRSAHTLTSLSIRSRLMAYDEIAAAIPSGSTFLTTLQIEVRRLDTRLLDLLAENLPGLRVLKIHLQWSRSSFRVENEITAESMQSRFYPDWKLHDLGIWSDSGRMEGNVMRLVASSVPSIKSFWGQGNLMTYN